MADMRVDFAGVGFQNPIVTASGTFHNGREFEPYYNLSQLGGVGVKAITLEPRLGNPPPRIAETPMGILNSVGLQNPGVDEFLKNDLLYLKKYDTKIIANISDNTIENNCEVARRLGDSVDLIELNVSCPNVKCGGMSFGTNPDTVAQITEAVKKCCKVPLVVKLSPNVTDIVQMALAAQNAGADGLALINTILGMQIDVHTMRPVLRNNTGGLSGPAVKPVAVRMIYQVANAVNIPIIGMGGVMTGEDAAELMLAGATLVAVGTANLVQPTAAVDIKQGLENYLDQKGLCAKDIIGKVQPY